MYNINFNISVEFLLTLTYTDKIEFNCFMLLFFMTRPKND